MSLTRPDQKQRHIFPYRGIIWGVTTVFVFLTARNTPGYFTAGLVLMGAGEALRIWGVGHIRYYRGSMDEVKKLVTSGPYAWLRNPLYLANAVIGGGVALLSGTWWNLALFAGVYGLLYGKIIREEEQYLARRFSEEYQAYAAAVPSMIPRLTPYRKSQSNFSWQVLLEKEIHTLITLGSIIGLFYLRLFSGLKLLLDRIVF